VAKGATELLKGVIKSGTGTRASLGSRPAAGKTGTTDNHVESWFVGYTAQRAAAVWVGTPYSQRGMNRITLAGQWYKGVFGGDIAAPIWKGIMEAASTDLPDRDFGDASSKVLNGDNIAIPYVSGMSVAQAISTLQAAGFSAQVAGTTSSGIARGLVVYTNPSGTATKGTTIGLYLSSGQAQQAPPPTTKSTPTPKPTKTKPGKKG
jgi:membrane peptidoglycan carboxypeptidase